MFFIVFLSQVVLVDGCRWKICIKSVCCWCLFCFFCSSFLILFIVVVLGWCNVLVIVNNCLDRLLCNKCCGIWLKKRLKIINSNIGEIVISQVYSSFCVVIFFMGILFSNVMIKVIISVIILLIGLSLLVDLR